MSNATRPIYALYRSLIREVRLLPTEYLRQFFRLKLSDDVRAALDSKDARLQKGRVKRMRQIQRKLQAANLGRRREFDHVLDLAYGRKGKLRAEILQPLLTDPKAPLPARMIHNVERSRPPAYSKELTTLLTTAYSRTTKALTLKALQHPHTLPPRADPSTNDAKFMGPLSKRREVNIRWKFFTEQHKRVHPPLQVVLEERTESGDVVHKTDSSSVLRAGIRPVGLQGSGVFEEVQALAASRPRRRSAHGKPYPDSHASQPDFRSHLPHRFLRRRFQFLLGRLPVMTYRRAMPGDSTSNAGKPGMVACGTRRSAQAEGGKQEETRRGTSQGCLKPK
ncbi:hypothetical protein SCP_0106960 [Sparassis crispa]|uniref:LYR motif-containing protein Cup1-like N-terminal domain-containing protein n=1 Tax=Sparassis crispa TaxID=139825 RepID=A0A401G6N6_9APHY|nr:hypothetical protein SCP_0106960 [Sparassis crispa]GBE77814.1 hypothetical protein SCP_0106960 [Sparassis crispa]